MWKIKHQLYDLFEGWSYCSPSEHQEGHKNMISESCESIQNETKKEDGKKLVINYWTDEIYYE